MKKISLNDIDKSRNNDNGEYQLDPTEKYVINLEEELQFQTAIMTSFQIMGAPPALKNYHAWLFKNNFSYEMPNPTNEVVAPYYGVGPLWKTEYSQGIVVRAEDDDDYYIVMECSSKNKGSNIGINKLESLLRSPRCPFVLYVGKKKLVKRKEFEKFISDNVEI